MDCDHRYDSEDSTTFQKSQNHFLLLTRMLSISLRKIYRKKILKRKRMYLLSQAKSWEQIDTSIPTMDKLCFLCTRMKLHALRLAWKLRVS